MDIGIYWILEPYRIRLSVSQSEFAIVFWTVPGFVFKFPKLKILETSLFRFSKVQKVKYLTHLWSNQRNFSNSNSLQVLKRRNFDPTTWRTSRKTFSSWCSTKKVRATQNFIKDKRTGRVNILAAFLKKLQKS